MPRVARSRSSLQVHGMKRVIYTDHISVWNDYRYGDSLFLKNWNGIPYGFIPDGPAAYLLGNMQKGATVPEVKSNLC